MARTQDRRGGVQRAHLGLERFELALLHQIDLVHDDAVGDHDLIDRVVIEVPRGVLGVDDRDDGVEVHLSGDRIDEKGLRDRRRIGHAARLDEDVVELVAAREELLHDAQ